MSIVAGADFGTLSVRISIFDRHRGKLGYASADYPLLRSKNDPDFATQRHADQMDALCKATQEAIAISGIAGHDIKAFALDTTGSSVIMVGEDLVPLDDYYLWCDHRAAKEAAEITAAAHAYKEGGFEGIAWCGGVYSSEWGWSKLLHWLRHNPEKRDQLVTALEHCDMVAATLCGVTDPRDIARSVCAMGHKWMWNERWGGLPPEDFLVSIDPLLKGIREKIAVGHYQTSDKPAGTLSADWAAKLGLTAGIPIPTGAFDAHWDAVGSNIRLGDVVNVIGTSTCIIGISDKQNLVPGVCGVVPGSVYPDQVGIEAGLSAVGDIFSAIATRAQTSVAELSEATKDFRSAQTGLLRLTWDNGDRTVLVNPALGGVTFGWTLTHTAADELFAAIEGTAMHTRIILERMEENGTEIRRVINGGGIPKRNPNLNQVYANVLNKPVLVADGDVTSLGSVIFAFLACGEFTTVKEAQDALCPPYTTFTPQPAEVPRANALFQLFRSAYFALGAADAAPAALGNILPTLRQLRRDTIASSKADNAPTNPA